MTHLEQFVYAVGWLFIGACIFIMLLALFHKLQDAWRERRDYYDIVLKISRLRTRAKEHHPEIADVCDYLLNEGDYEDKCWDALMFLNAIDQNRERAKEREEQEARMRNA